MKNQLTALALIATSVFAVPALAHPRLLNSKPAAASVGPSPSAITMAFSEKVVPRFTGASVVMTSMPGMAMAKPMGVGAVASTFGPDGKTLMLRPVHPLAPGSYQVNWHAVAADTHRVSGKFAFTVR